MSGGNEIVTVNGGSRRDIQILRTSTYTSSTLALVTSASGSVVDLEYSASGFTTGSTTSVTTSILHPVPTPKRPATRFLF